MKALLQAGPTGRVPHKMRKWRMGLGLLIAAAASGFMAGAEPAQLNLQHRWLYVQRNLEIDADVETTITLLERAAMAGYNGLVLQDRNFMQWDTLAPNYLANAHKVLDACRRLKMEFIPHIFPIGYSQSLLAHDPNLAEGLPVMDAPFVVRNGSLVPADDPVRILNGGFEEYQGNTPAGWSDVAMPDKISFMDTDVKFEGKASLRMQDIRANDPQSGNASAAQLLKLRPFSYYHVSVAVKTQDFEAARSVRLQPMGAGSVNLNYFEPNVQKTQDWRRADIVFNSLEFSEITLRLIVSGDRGGKIWWDDVRIEPAGLVNVLRRDGTPLRVTSEDGKTVYQEGRDFGAVRDPKFFNGPQPGRFSIWHEAPSVPVPAGSALKEGQKVFFSYFHPTAVHSEQIMCCMAEPKVYELLKWQAEQTCKNLQPDGYFMAHDEMRCQGWDESCARTKMTPGQLLAENVKRCVGILGAADPGKPIYVWSDMFDPYHNARKPGRYYLVKGDGPWYGSWEGLPKEVTVVSWHVHERGRLESLKHFAALGNKQILAGYYDANPALIRPWLNEAAQVEGVVGAMYTTWRNNYADLEKFAAELGPPR